MAKLDIIENQLNEAMSELREINDDKNQLIYDYVEYALSLTKHLNIKEKPDKAYRAVSDGFDVVILANSFEAALDKLENNTIDASRMIDKKPITVIF